MSACRVLLATQGDGVGTCEAKRAGCHTIAVTLPCTFRRMRCGPRCGDGACKIVSEEFTSYRYLLELKLHCTIKSSPMNTFASVIGCVF